ncbi:synaptonemal complex protein 1-like [Liolophura sinensis]|uniref:synaptonemal complex protein 1-like n=1 Tax=Liolophura sinensis TaxID=3198878 RepID=UPI00315817B2
MQQNQAVRERQPFFKPLSNMDKAGSLFNFGGSSDRNPKAVESSQLTQAREKVEHTSNLFKKTDQDQNEGAGRLSSLHAKLHQEADKIRRWKTQTEMELKKKESQVSEAVQTIESLRKSILELQLQNENLSLKLQDEKTNQEEIVRKIDATRNMCNLLKDHTADVEGRLVKCETERTELKYLEKTHTRQFEELSSRFKDLNISFAEEKEKLVEQVAEGKKAQEELKSDLNSKLCEGETQLQQLLHENHIKGARINELQMDLENNQQALDKAITEMDTLKQRYVEVEEEYERQSKLLQDTLDDFRSTKAEKVTLESHCHEVGQALNEATKAKDDLVTEFDAQKLSHENALLSLREEINVANQTLEEEKNRMKDMCLQYEKSQATVEELKSSRDILIKEKSEIQIQLSEMEREKVLLEALHSSDELTMSDLKMELERVVTELAVAKKEVCHRKEEAEVLRQQLGDVQIVKETALGDLSNLRDEMDEKLKLIERLQSDIHTAQESEEQQKENYKRIRRDTPKTETTSRRTSRANPVIEGRNSRYQQGPVWKNKGNCKVRKGCQETPNFRRRMQAENHRTHSGE